MRSFPKLSPNLASGEEEPHGISQLCALFWLLVVIIELEWKRQLTVLAMLATPVFLTLWKFREGCPTVPPSVEE